MTTNAAKIIIDADDLASKKFAIAAANAEKNIKHIKDVGGKAKASTEFFGQLANVMGGSQLAGYASQLAGLTEKVSQFSEVSKAGGAGALAFKAGLVGLVATISVGVGKAIGDVIFQTEKWNKELERTNELASKLSSQVEQAARAAGEFKSIEQLDKDIEAKNKQIEAYRKSVAAVDETWSGWFSKVSGNVRELNEQNKKQIEEAEKLKEIYKEQAMELRKKVETDKEEAKIAEQKKMAEEAAEQEKKRLEDLADAQKKANDEAEKAAQKKIDDAKRIADIRDNEIAKLEEERILLTEGAEAARRFALERQGIDKDSAARIAAAESELDKLKETGPDSVEIGQQAVQSRLLTRGPAEKGIDKIEKNTADALAKFDQMIRELEKYKPQAQLEIVG